MKFLLPVLVTTLFFLSQGGSGCHAQERSSLVLGRGQITSVNAATTTVYTPAERGIQAPAEPAAEISVAANHAPAFPSLSPTLLQSNATGEPAESTASRVAGPAITVTSSLAVVLGLFAALIWLTRKFGGRSAGNGSIPKEVLQNLGSVSIDPRTQVTMLRCGQRILIMARTNTSVHPLGEITNPDEVRSLTAACMGDSKQAFASALQSIESEPSESGYVGDRPVPLSNRSRGRLFATA